MQRFVIAFIASLKCNAIDKDRYKMSTIMNNRNLRKRKVAQVFFAETAAEKTIIVTLFVPKHFLLTPRRSFQIREKYY
jgi:hypothetical protein